MLDRITDRSWDPHSDDFLNNERIFKARRRLEGLVCVPASFEDVVVTARDNQTQLLIYPTDGEIETVLCGDEGVAMSFNSFEFDPSEFVVAAQTAVHENYGEDPVLTALILSPKNPSVAKPGVSLDGRDIQYVLSRDEGWYKVSRYLPQHHLSFGQEPKEEDISGKPVVMIDMLNKLCEGSFHFHHPVMSRLQGSAYRWAIRLFEARRAA